MKQKGREAIGLTKNKKKTKTRWMCEHNEVVYTFSEPLRFGTSLLSIFPNTFMKY